MAESNIITILGIAITAATAIIVATVQVNKTFKTSYKIEAYKDISSKIRVFSDKQSRYFASLTVLQARQQMILDGTPVISESGNHSFSKLTGELNDVVDATLELMHLIDIYQIVCPDFNKYRKAFKNSLASLPSTTFINLLIQFQPRQDGQPTPTPPLASDSRSRFITEISGQTDRATDLLGQVNDFSVAAQNVLMGDIFGNKINYRSPPDKKVSRVIRLETPFLKRHKRFLIMLLGVLASILLVA